MSKLDSISGRATNYTFVLWGEQFDEATAAIMTTKLRQAGLCVKLVGVAGRRPIGRNGLALYPDMVLGEALDVAEQAICVVLPCSATILKFVEIDPRIADFFKKTHSNGARFIVSDTNSIEQTSLEQLSLSDEDAATYESTHDIIAFADDLAADLSRRCGI